MKRYNLIIADDHVMFLDGLHNILSEVAEIDRIHLATDGEQVLRLLKQFEVDMIISDINMPNVDGMELLTQVKKRHPQKKFFVLSMLDDTLTINKVIKKGANGYLLKFADKNELKNAVTSVLNGDDYFSPSVKEKHRLSTLENRKYTQVQLSNREKEVLNLLSEEFTSKEIAEQLCISVNTVETHRKNILLKTASKTTTGAVKFALKNGILE